MFININNNNGERVLKGELGVQVSYDTEYGRVIIYNKERNNEKYRIFSIDGASESATYINENKRNDLVYEYTKYYDLMFSANIDIKNVLMIGRAGYTYPKYFISKYLDKNIDVVEIDGLVTKLANKYFYLDELKDKNRLNIFTEDGRVFLNKNKKKYDAILNDTFHGEVPSKTLTTIEAVNKIYNSLNKNGVYLTNIVGSFEGENSKFLKSEIYTLRQVFKNVYVIPCNDTSDKFLVQNNMVIATNDNIDFEHSVEINLDNLVIFTDNYCPVEKLT